MEVSHPLQTEHFRLTHNVVLNNTTHTHTHTRGSAVKKLLETGMLALKLQTLGYSKRPVTCNTVDSLVHY